MKKKILILPLLLVTLLPFVKVSAKSSTLMIGYNNYHTGESRDYADGSNTISIYVNYLINSIGQHVTNKISRIGMQYIENSGSYCLNLGKVTEYTDPGNTTYHNWGYMSAGNRFYTYYTNIDGEGYDGLYSSNVTFSPLKN